MGITIDTLTRRDSITMAPSKSTTRPTMIITGAGREHADALWDAVCTAFPERTWRALDVVQTPMTGILVSSQLLQDDKRMSITKTKDVKRLRAAMPPPLRASSDIVVVKSVGDKFCTTRPWLKQDGQLSVAGRRPGALPVSEEPCVEGTEVEQDVDVRATMGDMLDKLEAQDHWTNEGHVCPHRCAGMHLDAFGELRED